MNKTLQKNLVFFLKNCVVWVIASILFGFFRFYGIPENLTTIDFEDYIPFWMHFLVGILAATFYTAIELLFELPRFKRMSFGMNLLGKAIASFFVVKFMMAVAYVSLISFHGELPIDAPGIREFLISRQYWVIFVFFIITAVSVSFLRQVDQKFGPGILWNMVRGKYLKPREEERIFMFIDLKSSTSIAEELGNLRYSQFIQDCFYDLNDVFPAYQAHVYQYVGDEAVLTWNPERGLAQHNCIHCFQAFTQKLKEKEAYYLDKYGHFPEFKAGAHAGPIVITEVGIVKKELAYHGDVINTTARIQSMCNEFDQHLLISQDLLDKLPKAGNLDCVLQSKLQLRGKKNETAIYAVNAT